jgi:hypothetical protein
MSVRRPQPHYQSRIGWVIVVAVSTSCNAILGIGEPVHPADSGSGSTGGDLVDQLPARDADTDGDATAMQDIDGESTPDVYADAADSNPGLDGDENLSKDGSGAAADAAIDTDAADGDGGKVTIDAADGNVDADACRPSGPLCPHWPDWPMPNSDQQTSLPNLESYDTSAEDVVTDLITGLTWQKTAPYDLYNWQEAQAYCASLGDGWRLPSRIELVSLVNTDVFRMYGVNPDAFPATSGWNANTTNMVPTFWTCSELSQSAEVFQNSSAVWTLQFGAGVASVSATSEKFQVRCVRGGSAGTPPPGRYTYPDANTVFDTKTMLTWELGHSPIAGYPSDAVQYCQNLGRGWRVPSLNELQTIVDECREDPAIDGIFPTPPDAEFWTSSPEDRDPTAGWQVGFRDGFTRTAVLADPGFAAFVRCVQ